MIFLLDFVFNEVHPDQAPKLREFCHIMSYHRDPPELSHKYM